MRQAPKRRTWIWAGALAVLAAALYVHFDLGRLLTLASLKASREALQSLYQQAPASTLAGFFGLYVAAAALSLPGAAVLTLAAGALFGFNTGLAVASFASSIGATLAFLASRHLLRDAVRARFGSRLAAIDEGLQRDGAWYLLTLRLVPVFPFFLVNLLAGLAPIAATRFYWVSQLGMLAGTAAYVNAGTQLARLERTSDVLSPALLASLALLGVLPLAARAAASGLRRRRMRAAWRRPACFDRNLVVIGAGSGGLVTAYLAAAVKAKVTLVESHRMGGDCLNTGCVPSKALIRSAKLAKQLRQADALGISGAAGRVDFAAVMARVHRVIHDIAPHDSAERYAGLGVEVIEGHARLASPWSVEIRTARGLRTLTTRSIVIATGARPVVPPIPGLDEVGCLTSETVWSLTELPRRLAVLGGGPLGCELAQGFARLGAQVTLVERSPRLLGREDPDASALVAQALADDGVRVLTGHEAVRCERAVLAAGPVKRLVVARVGGAQPEAGRTDPGREGVGQTNAGQMGIGPADAEHVIEFDALLCAVGRQPRVEGFGLQELGIALTPHGTIETDAYLRTRHPNIYAVGDVAGPYQLTHAAAHQAWYAVVNALFGSVRRFKADYSVMPWTTFTDPEVARVGLSETEAQAQGIAHEVTRYDLGGLERAITDDAARGFVKVLTAPGKDRILGVTIVGEHAGELLAEYVLAMRHGLGLSKILGTVHAYPTMSEANKHAAGQWRRAHAPQRLLAWAERFHAWQRA